MDMVEIAEQTRRRRGRPQIRCDEDTRRLLIEAARREFQASGYAGTCINGVLQRAGLSTREGVPGNGKPFPEGSKLVKIEWSQKNPGFPYFVMVPDTLKTVAFIVKDSKRFPDTHGWAYAQFAYDAASDTFKPAPLSLSGAECGYACHATVAAKDYIFTAYPRR
jgi:hypothetical protein